jgi:hypothetical protein
MGPELERGSYSAAYGPICQNKKLFVQQLRIGFFKMHGGTLLGFGPESRALSCRDQLVTDGYGRTA